MQASFHAYEDGVDKPYVTGIDRLGKSLANQVLGEIKGSTLLKAEDEKRAREAARGKPQKRGWWPWSRVKKEQEDKDVREDNSPPSGWVPVAFIDDTKTETQFWLYRPTDGTKKIIVAFRGTSNGKDFMTDFSFKHKELVELGPKEGEAAADKLSVHGGFWAAFWDSVGGNGLLYRLVDAVIEKAEAEANGGGKRAGGVVDAAQIAVDASSGAAARAAAARGGEEWEVLVTGHSLGGALATLATYKLATLQQQRRECESGEPLYSLRMYTFGAPRVGNTAFARAFDDLVAEGCIDEAWRFASPNDLVPTVPTIGLDFCHCGTLCHVFQKKVVHIMPDEKAYSVLMRFIFNLWTFFRAMVMGRLGFRITTWHSSYKKFLAGDFSFVDKRGRRK